MKRRVEVRTDLQLILVDQALAMAKELELELVSDAVPNGQVLAVTALAAIRTRRELTRHALEAALQRHSDPAEAKGRPSESACRRDASSSRTKPKTQTEGRPPAMSMRPLGKTAEAADLRQS